MSIEEKDSVHYIFPISVLKNEYNWFELLEYDTNEPIKWQ